MDGTLEPPASIFTVPLQRRKLSDRPVDQCATLKNPARTDASEVAGASAAAREGHRLAMAPTGLFARDGLPDVLFWKVLVYWRSERDV